MALERPLVYRVHKGQFCHSNVMRYAKTTNPHLLPHST
jgi:hypothetical protein